MAKRRATSNAFAPQPAITFTITEPPKFDLQSYISNYIGRTRLDRLQTIGHQSQYFSRDAFSLALSESKRGKDVQRYADLVALYRSIWPDAESTSITDDGVVLDQQWVDDRTRAIKAEGDRLESELKGYKNNLIKESIRMGMEDLATHHLLTGDLPSAHKDLTRMREYCTTPKHIAEMHLKLCLVAVAQGQWLQLEQSVQRVQSAFATAGNPAGSTAAALAKGAQNVSGDQNRSEPLTLQQEQCIAYGLPLPPLLGLAAMNTNNYKSAAYHFLRTDPDYFNMHEGNFAAQLTSYTSIPLPSSFASSSSSSSTTIGGVPPINKLVLSPSDIATYATLCALCTFSRSELATSLLHNSSFRAFLDEEPHLRRAIAAFVGGKYATVLEVLDAYRGDWLCDLYLCRVQGGSGSPARAELMIEKVRERCIVQYASVFSRIKIADMAAAFSISSSSASSAAAAAASSHALATASTATISDDATASNPIASTDSTEQRSHTQLDPNTKMHNLLLHLVETNALPSFRLDAVTHELVAVVADERRAVLEQSVAMAREKEEQLRLRLFRIGMKGAGLEVVAS